MFIKNLVLSLCLITGIASVAKAQTQAGNILAGGVAGWNKSENQNDNTSISDDKRNEFNVQPMAGVFLKDKLAMGLLVNYFHIQSEINYALSDPHENYTFKSSAIAVGPFIRQYFTLNDKFAFYGQAMVGYSFSKSEYKHSSNTQANGQLKQGGLIAAVKPGIAFFVTQKIGIDLSVQGLQYNLWKSKSYAGSSSNFSAGFNLPNLSFGCNYYLTR